MLRPSATRVSVFTQPPAALCENRRSGRATESVSARILKKSPPRRVPIPGIVVAPLHGVKVTNTRSLDALVVAVDFIDQEDTPVAKVAVPAAGVPLDALERALIVFALSSSQGNRTRAARFLGLSRSALIYRMHKHGLVTGL